MTFQFIENTGLLSILINIIFQTFLFSIAAYAVILMSNKLNIHLKTFTALCSVIIILALPLLLLLIPPNISPLLHLNLKIDDVSSQSTELMAVSENKTTNFRFDPIIKANNESTINIDENSNIYLSKRLIQILITLWFIISLCKLILIGTGLLKIRDYRKNSISLDIIDIETSNKDFSIPFDKKDANNSHPQKKHFPKLYISDSFSEPSAFGLLKPGILIPRKLYNNSSPEELKAIIMHEFSHILNNDQLIGLLQRVCLALYWWNPLIYYINKRFSRSREEMADIYAAANLGSAVYAKCLVSVAAKLNGIKPIRCAIGFAAPHFKLNQRIRNILKGGKTMSLKPNKTKIVLLFMLIISLALLSAFNRITVAQETCNQAVTNQASEDIWAGAIKVTDAKMKPGTFKDWSISNQIVTILKDLQSTNQKADFKEFLFIFDTLIGEKGEVLAVRIDSINNEPLTKMIFEWVKDFKYEPYIIDGKTVKVLMTFKVKFDNHK